MFEHQGMWLPDGEKHFPTWMDKSGERDPADARGRGTYQLKKWKACLPFIRERSTGVDVGAHVGFWSIQMERHFDMLVAFEPVAEFRECWARNMEGSVAFLYPFALGSGPAKVRMRRDAADSGGTHVGEFGEDAEMRTLDSFGLGGVGFIKLDCEGYEHHVLEGARATINRDHPCIIVEQKPHKLGPNFGISGTPAVDLLKGIGYQVRKEMGGDYIMTWGPA